MGELRGVLVRAEGLVWFHGVLVVVGVPLQFEKEVVGEAVRSVPRVSDCDFLVGTVGELLSSESIVFDVVDDL